MSAPSPAVMAPAQAMAMSGFASQHLSTPKTSVLGPKRVACDACRRRRIKCKHKDLVMQVQAHTLSNGSPFGADVDGHLDFGDFGASPLKHHNLFVNVGNAHGHGPLPGTNAYITANIPMAMNGVPMFGDPAKRGRSKACEECRRSKRRCVHDSNGNVDPVKAAENPVPRGSLAAKKKQLVEKTDDAASTPGQTLSQPPAPAAPMGYAPVQPCPSPSQQTSQVQHQPTPPQQLQHQQQLYVQGSHSPTGSSHFSSTPSATSHHDQQMVLPVSEPESLPHFYHETHNAPMDPHLFSAYIDAGAHGPYYGNGFPYSINERPHLFNLPSLEQIASEVLDMDDKRDEAEPDEHRQPQEAHHEQHSAHESLPNGSSEADGSIDSAISLPKSQPPAKSATASDSLLTGNETVNGVDDASSTEAKQCMSEASVTSPTQRDEEDARPTTSHSNLDTIPVFRPPAPVPRSPEAARKSTTNGAVLPKSPNLSMKRKRDSISQPSPRPTDAKKNKSDNASKSNGDLPQAASSKHEEDDSVRLAKSLQQEDLGLRRRSKS